MTNNLNRLANSKAFQKIVALESKHNIFNAFQTAIDENAYSRFLAYLLDSTYDHGLKSRFFIRFIKKLDGFPKMTMTGISTQCYFNWQTTHGRFIDIVIKIRNIHDNTILGIIGIENKTISGESENQIKDYQDALSHSFKNAPIAILFLTPDGCLPISAHNKSKISCPVIPIPYQRISKICEMNFSGISDELHVFLKEFGRFIKTDLLEGNVMDITKRKVTELLKNNKYKKAIEAICRYAPYVRTIRNLVYEKLIENLKNETGISKISVEWHYPKYSARPREFNLSIGDLNDKLSRRKIRIFYMLDSCSINEPDIGDEFIVRCMICDWGYDPTKGKSNAAKQLYKKITKLSNLPASQSTDRQWDRWFCLYSGAGYKLVDIEEKDVEGLSTILYDCIQKTYNKINKAISKL